MAKKIPGLSVIVFFIAVAVALSGCATRHYVKTQIGTLEPQITEVRDAQLEQAERIDAVDRRAKEGVTAANQAGMTALMAGNAAAEAARRAGDADRRADTAQVNAQRAINRIESVEREMEIRIGNLDKYAVAEQKTVTFKFDSDELTKDALVRLDDIAARVSGAK